MWTRKFDESLINRVERGYIDEILVACRSEEDAIGFLELLLSYGYRWFSREEINPYSKNHWCVYEEDTCYSISTRNRKVVMFGRVDSNYAQKVKENWKFVYCSQYESFHNPSIEDIHSLLFVGGSVVRQ